MAPEPDLKDTDRCVMCGLCLPHCPTYGLSRDEGDSPRGRIALMQGLASGALPVGERLLVHLDRCLECRACEAMCPSEVPFGRLMDAARARVEPRRPRSPGSRRLRRLGFGLLRHPRRLRALAAALRLYQRTGLQWLARRSGLLRLLRLAPLEARLPRLRRPLATGSHAPAGPPRGRVALFTGCVEAVAGSDTQRAALRLLTTLGFAVDIPRGQGCCGALAAHNGVPELAAELARANLAAFADQGWMAVLSTASACAAELAAYGRQHGDRDARAPGFARQARDITAFLAEQDWPRDLLRPLPETVAVHDPCTLRHGLRQHRAVYRLLERIPQLRLVTLNDTGTCCGAAGAHRLTQPALADALRQPQIERLRSLGVGTLVSSNIGCALHLAAGIREAGLEIEVLHPVALLARQLRG